jgi:hypothetical protein
LFGGEGEIRTHEGREAPPVFKTGAFNRSATSPGARNSAVRLRVCPAASPLVDGGPARGALTAFGESLTPFGEPATLKWAGFVADTGIYPSRITSNQEGSLVASSCPRPLRARKAMAAWKLVMHQGMPVSSAADQLNTTPQRVEYMLLALARRRASRLSN